MRQYQFWTNKEIERLKLVYPDPAIEWAALKIEFPRHPIDSIACKARSLGLTRPKVKTGRDRWTSCEIDLLKRFYPEKGRAKCAILLNRTTEAIATKAYTLGLRRIFETPPKKISKWLAVANNHRQVTFRVPT